MTRSSPPGSAARLAALLFLTLSTACERPSATVEARPVLPDGEVRLPVNSPKLASLGIDTVRIVTDRTIAVLPAQLVPDEDHTVRMQSPVTGRIVTLLAKAGDHVSAGQPLAELRSGDAAQVTSDAARAATAWATARAAFRRAADLAEHKVISAREFEQAHNDEAQAHAEATRASARAAQLGLGGHVSDTFVLRAPVSGVIIDRTANPGAEVRPDNAQPLFTISSLDVLWLAVAVPQRDVALVHRGARLRFRSEAIPGESVEARVTFVSDALDPTSRTATVRAVVPNPGGRLRLQTTGEASLLVTDRAPSLVVPSRALVTRGPDTVVFVVLAPGRFVRRVVTVRDDDGTSATLASGLAAGERVVTTGSLLLAAEANRAP